MGLLNFKLRYGWLFDDKGEFHTRKWFSKHSKSFSYGEEEYIVDLNCPTYIDLKGVLWDNRHYLYNKGNPEPIVLNKKFEPRIPASQFYIIMKTETAKKLNDLQKTGLMALLTPRNIIIGVAIVFGLIYLAQGGSITGGTT